MIALHL